MIVYKECSLFGLILFVLYLFLDSVNRSIDAPPRPPPRSGNRQNPRENPFNSMNNTMIQRAAPPPPTSKTNPSNTNTQGNAVCLHQFTHYSAQ